MPVKTKVCNTCDQRLSVSAFYKDSQKADGRKPKCKACFDKRTSEIAERRAAGEIVPRVSDEERQRRSEQALRMHAEGKLGGAAYGRLGGRPRNRDRINHSLLDHFREPDKQQLIIDAVESNLRSRSKADRMKAVSFLHQVEMDEDKRLRDDRGGMKNPEEMSEEELAALLEQGIQSMLERGELGNVITLAPEAVQDIA